MPGGASEGGGGIAGPTAGAGNGGGTSCAQAKAAHAQTTSTTRKELRIFMEGELNQFLPGRERAIFGLSERLM
jgi:hypothetical protein